MRIVLLFLLIIFSCNSIEKNEKADIINQKLTAKVDSLLLINKQQSSLIKYDEQSKKSIKSEEEVKTIIDSKYLTDTLDSKEHGTGYIFKRNVEVVKLNKTFSIEDIGTIGQFLEVAGYKVFTMCDGKSLPLEMCNCTQNIYITAEPNELEEPFELFRVGLFFDVELVSLKTSGSPDWETVLTFKHGKYPRKTKSINFNDFKLKEN